MSWNRSALYSKNDIVFQPAQVVITQPTIYEINFLGEDSFYTGCSLLTFDKNNLLSQDKIKLEDKTNFDIIMSVISNNSTKQVSEKANNALDVLRLVFPKYNVIVASRLLILQQLDTKAPHLITNENYVLLNQILSEMFCLKRVSPSDGGNYNPQGYLANKIADKLKKGKKVLEQQNTKPKHLCILNRYASILSVGLKKDINELMQYSVYQLFEQFKRYELKEEWDFYIEGKRAGAENLQEPNNWMADLHNLDEDKDQDIDFTSGYISM